MYQYLCIPHPHGVIYCIARPFLQLFSGPPTKELPSVETLASVIKNMGKDDVRVLESLLVARQEELQ